MIETGSLVKKAVFIFVLSMTVAASAAHADGPHATIRYTMGNDTRMVVRRNLGSEIVSMVVLVPAGPALEPEGQDGISNFLAKILLRGTTARKADEIAMAFDACGAEVKGGAEWDYLALKLRVPRREYRTAMALLAECLYEPAFNEHEIELMKSRILGEIAKADDDMFEGTLRHFYSVHYRDHPYGKALLGTAATIRNLSSKGLQNFYTGLIRPKNVLVVFVGDVPVHEALDQARRCFGNRKDKPVPPESPLLFAGDIRRPVSGGESSVIDKKREQTFIIAGISAPPVGHRDYLTLKVIDFLLGGGMSSRLFVNLREKRSLGYDVSAFYPDTRGSSTFILYGGCGPEKEPELMSGLIDEARRLRESPVETEELARAKAKLKGYYALRNQVSLAMAESIGLMELVGVGYEFADRRDELLDTVTADEVLKAVRRYFQPNRWTIAITRGGN